MIIAAVNNWSNYLKLSLSNDFKSSWIGSLNNADCSFMKV